jgi:Arc/MetJ family transcription regulator
MYNLYIFICIKTTLSIDDTLLREAATLTGVSGKTALVRMGLAALIAQESAKRLADLGGTEPKASAAPRRRPNSVA